MSGTIAFTDQVFRSLRQEQKSKFAPRKKNNSQNLNRNSIFSLVSPSFFLSFSSHGLNVGLIYGFKGLILVFGLFLAYETRSIKVKQINDSRYVGMSIYNVVVFCLITAPVAMVIASQQDASFAFMALAVIFCCFLSMLLIFVPKVRIFPVLYLC